ncbi:MAG: hypothetical protein JOZ54_11010 [Acidobacteria bacterium]|nr:hypothetical protein [Acidobacteriota bacterium]
MTPLAHMTARLRTAAVIDDPFPHYTLRDVFPADYYESLLLHLPTSDVYQNLYEVTDLKLDHFRHRDQRDFTSGWNALLPAPSRDFWNDFHSWFLGEELARAALASFGIAFDGEISVESQLIRHRAGYFLGPHSDANTKLVVLLLYLAPDATAKHLGTSIYKPKQAGFGCRDSKHYPFEDFERVKTARYEPNALLAFRRSDRSFHGVEPLRDDAPRDLIQYVVYDKAARQTQLAARSGRAGVSPASGGTSRAAVRELAGPPSGIARNTSDPPTTSVCITKAAGRDARRPAGETPALHGRREGRVMRRIAFVCHELVGEAQRAADAIAALEDVELLVIPSPADRPRAGAPVGQASATDARVIPSPADRPRAGAPVGQASATDTRVILSPADRPQVRALVGQASATESRVILSPAEGEGSPRKSQILRSAQDHKVDLIVTATELLLEDVALANEALGIPAMSPETVRRALDKRLLKRTLANAGIPVPKETTLGPAVRKAERGTGGLSTWRLCEGESAAFAEEWLEGDEVCVDTITIDDEPRFASVCCYRPSILTAIENPSIFWSCVMPRDLAPFAELIEHGKNAVRALRVGNAMTHMEGFLRDGRLLGFHDATLRPAGARIAPMLTYAYGIDPYRAWARAVIDGAFDGPWERRWAVGTIFLRGDGRGTIERLHGIDAVRNEIGRMIAEARLPRIGAPASATYTGDGFITVRHPETEAVEDALRFIAATVRIDTSGAAVQRLDFKPAWDAIPAERGES